MQLALGKGRSAHHLLGEPVR